MSEFEFRSLRYYTAQGWRPLGTIMSDEGFAELVEMNLFVKDLS